MPSEKRARQRALRDQKRAVEERRANRRRQLRRAFSALVVVGIIIALIVVLSSGSPKKTAATGSTTTTVGLTTTTAAAAQAPACPPATAAGAAKRVTSFAAAPKMCIAQNSVLDATIKTDVGTFVVRLTTATAPLGVNDFVFLARYHFFDGIIFHRVIPGFVVQGGDPTGTGTGGPGYSFTGNTPPSSCTAAHDCYVTGDVALANSGSTSSDGSQFFVVLPGGGPGLADSYTLIGKVTSGLSVVEAIGNDGSASGTPKIVHKMLSVTIQQVTA